MKQLARLTVVAMTMAAPSAVHAQQRYDIIDMHFHAERPDAEGPPGGTICAPYPKWLPRDPGRPITDYLERFSVHPDCPHPLVAPVDAAVLRDKGVAALRRLNMLALAGGDAATVEDFRAHAPERILPSAGFGSDGVLPSIAELRRLHAAGKLAALSEITTQYAGIAPDDPKLEPYYALAEELDIRSASTSALGHPAPPTSPPPPTGSRPAIRCSWSLCSSGTRSCGCTPCTRAGRSATP